MIIFNAFMVFLLIALTAYFVSIEFAIVKVRKSRLDQLAEEGNGKAAGARKVVTNLDEYLSACQLGITITALGLGWLGEPTVQVVLHPLIIKLGINESLTAIISFVLSFLIITYLNVVIGELAPKTISIQKAEAISLALTPSLIWFHMIAYPFIKILNGSARLIVKMVGLEPASESDVAHSEEELRIILSESYEKGEINQAEYRYVNKIFEFDNRLAKEIMVPRTEMVTVALEDTLDENLNVMKNERYTRYPVQDGDKDNIIGVVNVKEVFQALYENKDLKGIVDITELMRPVIMVIETVYIHDLLIRMQKERIHIAILVDEYGGTAGLVTVEDILEEIVGEIQDEFDTDELPYIQKMTDWRYMVDGKALIDEINDILNLEIESEDMDTIGGWILSQNLDIKKGESIIQEGCQFKIMDIEGHHIRSIEIIKREPVKPAIEESEGS
ncbi:hemolysin family protein [Metabacillus sp. RGM 3146]|uniref:hemolysin family protein n=1 Tax=Metabacillus sp. RGM 3146 TaxID=3401092 RepID=UPI003B9BC805